jgi:hypothetical protein
MTDKEWNKIREGWRKKVKDGDLKCNCDMIPFALSNQKEPWQWVSRAYLEEMQKICDTPEFKKSVKEGMRFLLG